MNKHRRARSFITALALLGAVTPAARADFVVKDPPAAALAPAPAPNAMAPIVDPDDRQPTLPADHRNGPTAIHWKMAYGFGNQVPLGFACRQIVPPAVKVTYGPGATPDMLVTWKGGNTWNHVLYNAVAPLGLRLVMTHMAVEIRK
jgi:hypothetical protein